ncbi:NADH dehydrogenase ubiquinone Fe-S protein 4 [Methylorubrum rhodesianum]|uniref:NADH dehydrogenase ubiquinone Fe-S protein 4 n=1 Tax=Methylorubrum rhodesianum TaxID=29427 RepID=UPI0031FA3850
MRRRKRPVGTAGRARENDWIFSFERRTTPEIDELMGWTGGDDTLATEVRLTFASRAEAIAYAERQGLDYDVEAEPERVPQASFVTPRFWARCGRHAFGRPLVTRTRSPVGQNLEDHTAPGTSSPDLEHALLAPAAIFSAPEAVLNQPQLTKEYKREILRR